MALIRNVRPSGSGVLRISQSPSRAEITDSDLPVTVSERNVALFSQTSLLRAEALGFPVALGVLLLVFGALVGMIGSGIAASRFLHVQRCQDESASQNLGSIMNGLVGFWPCIVSWHEDVIT
jgi:hypothetical protein